VVILTTVAVKVNVEMNLVILAGELMLLDRQAMEPQVLRDKVEFYPKLDQAVAVTLTILEIMPTVIPHPQCPAVEAVVAMAEPAVQLVWQEFVTQQLQHQQTSMLQI
jgi:hypothetical protein